MTDGRTTIDVLADAMFLRNPDNVRMTLSVPSLGCSQSLFLFCVDLLMRGLLLTRCPRCSSPLPVHDISDGHFSHVSRKMACAGIKVSKSTRKSESIRSSVNLEDIMAQPRDLDLPLYCLRVNNRGVRHDITFEITHNVPTGISHKCCVL